jgi:hypothetical protein
MTSEDIIRKWIEDLATGAHGPHYRHILENGKAFDKIARRLSQRRHFKMDNKTRDKGCFVNSQRFAQAYPNVKYCEGFRFGGVVVQGCPIIPDCAWNVVDGDQVVEWANWKGQDGRSPVYFGVEVPVEFLKRYLGKQIVIPNPECPGISVPVDLTLGTPLLGWYLRLKEGGMA